MIYESKSTFKRRALPRKIGINRGHTRMFVCHQEFTASGGSAKFIAGFAALQYANREDFVTLLQYACNRDLSDACATW